MPQMAWKALVLVLWLTWRKAQREITLAGLRRCGTKTHWRRAHSEEMIIVKFLLLTHPHMETHIHLCESSSILTGIEGWAGRLALNWVTAMTSVLRCHWHLEQGGGISISQRVHYEWIMHFATSLDVQQSECQNSFEHTFLSPWSRISRLNKNTRNPISSSFLHYDNHRNSTRGERRQCQKRRYRW